MNEYVKKPIPIKAVQFFDTDECAVELQELGLDPVRVKYPEKQLIIATLEGEMRANEGDYIIKGDSRRVLPMQAGHLRGILRRLRRSGRARISKALRRFAMEKIKKQLSFRWHAF